MTAVSLVSIMSVATAHDVTMLPAGPFTIVVAEGSREAASAGSYTVRTYETGRSRDGVDLLNDFIDGMLKRRDGGLEKAWLANLAPDRKAVHLIVWCVSAGSGGYGSIDVFEIGDDGRISFLSVPSRLESSEGYMGHDKFFTRDGVLYREHPIYRPDDPGFDPTGGTARYMYDFETHGWSAQD